MSVDIQLDSQRELIHDPALVDPHVYLEDGHEDQRVYPLVDYLAEEPDHVLQVQGCQQDCQEVEHQEGLGGVMALLE